MKMIILAVAFMAMVGCATTTGKDVGAAVTFAGDIAGAIFGVPIGSGASAAIAVGGVVGGAAVENAIDKDGLKAIPDEEKAKEGP